MANTTNSDASPYKFDIREDEEQYAKLDACVNLFVASGYFRARMKGLAAFDKIVGGLAWAIEICNYEADIDIFHDSLSIGQKIALTEKIVETLKQMQCPHRIEPHQIQGLDFIHIYPVVQWLVKQTLEHRVLVAQRMRSSGVQQFIRVVDSKTLRNWNETDGIKSLSTFCGIDSDVHATPVQRYYKWTARDAELDKLPDDADDDKLLQMTFLEYNPAERQEETILSTGTAKKTERSTQDNELDLLRAEGGIKKAVSKVKAAKIGQLMAESSSAIIDKLAADYAVEQQRMKDNDEGGYAGTPTQKLRLLEKRVAARRQRVDELEIVEQDMRQRHTAVSDSLATAQKRKHEIEQKISDIAEQIRLATKNSAGDSAATIEVQVKQYEDLKRQNQTFKKECKQRAVEFENEITHLEKQLDNRTTQNDSSSNAEQQFLQQQLDDARQALTVSRSSLAVVSRELGTVQRQQDAVPGPAEISQYQRRFIELYEEVNTWHRQLRQLYSIYNQCQDSLQFYEKEIGLFDSINDNFRSILDSDDLRSKENLLLQLQETLESVSRNVAGADAALSKAVAKREQATRDYSDKLDQQRRYASMLREFQRECVRNEKLVAAVNQSGC